MISRRKVALIGASSWMLLSGCISYRSTGSTPAPIQKFEITGSHIPVDATSAKSAADGSAVATRVYTHEEIERSGAVDLVGVMERIPSARVHR